MIDEGTAARMAATAQINRDGPALCAVDTCGENNDGQPHVAEFVVFYDDDPETPVLVCSCHADGWYEDSNQEREPERFAWDTAAMQVDFEVLGFAAPCVVVRRRSDGVKGSMYFTHSPRVYFDFQKTS